MFGNKLKEIRAWSMRYGIFGILFACVLLAWSFSGMAGSLWVGMLGLVVFYVTIMSAFSRILRENSLDNSVKETNAIITGKLELLEKKQNSSIAKIEEKLDSLRESIKKEKQERTEEIQAAVLAPQEQGPRHDDIEALVQRYMEDYFAKETENIRTDLFKALEHEKSERKTSLKNEKKHLLEEMKTSAEELFNALDSEKKERTDSIEALRKKQKNIDPKRFKDSLNDLVKGLKDEILKKETKIQSLLDQHGAEEHVAEDEGVVAGNNNSLSEEDFVNEFDFAVEDGKFPGEETESDAAVSDGDVIVDSGEEGFSTEGQAAVSVKEKKKQTAKKSKKSKKTKKAKKSKKKSSKK